ncbi:MAG: TonB-dependent receptor [Alphaproteobacteria bacterium]
MKTFLLRTGTALVALAPGVAIPAFAQTADESGNWVVNPVTEERAWVGRRYAQADTTVQPAAAQPATVGQEPRPWIEKIVVSARKKEEGILEVPIAIEVRSGTQIQNQIFRDLQELIENVPAVNVSRTGSADFLNIRGVGSGESVGFEQSVAFVIDGITLGRSRASRTALLDSERVEILKGPQTTYFGANTIAGAISVTSRGADLDAGYSGYGRLSYEFEQQEVNFEGAANIPITDDLAARIAVKFLDSDGYIEDTFIGEDLPSNRDIVVRGSALWEPIEKLSVDFRFTYGSVEADNSGLDTELVGCTPGTPMTNPAQLDCIQADGQPVDSTLNLRRSQDLPEFRELDYITGVLTVNYDLNDFTVTTVTGYYDFENEFRLDLDGTSVDPGPGFTTRSGLSQFDEADQFSQEIRLASPTGGTFEWVAGLYFQDESAAFSQVVVNSFLPAPATFLAALRSQEYRTYSVFGELTYNFLRDLRGIVGLRFIHVDQDISISPNSPVVPQADGVPDILSAAPLAGAFFSGDFERSDTDVLPSVTVQYDFAPNANVYGSWRQGFKAGGFSLVNPTPGVTADFAEEFDKEEVNAFEVGVKGLFLDGKVQATAALFRMVFTDRQVASLADLPPGTPAGNIQPVENAAKSVSQGIEIGFIARLLEQLTVQGELVFLDSEFTEFEDAICFTGQTPAQGCIDGRQDLSGEETTFAPTYSGNFTLTYDYPFREYIVTAQPNVFFTDGFQLVSDNNPITRQDSYVKFNFRLSVKPESERWEVALVGRNLNDEITTSGLCNEVPNAPGGTLGCVVDPPRTIALQGVVNF